MSDAAATVRTPTPAASVCVAPSSGALVAVRHACPQHFREYGGVGVNLFDALWCSVDGNNTQSACTHADVLRAMESLAQTGVRFFRFFASLWGSRQVQWLVEPGRYWAAFDRLVDDSHRLGLHIVPSIGAEMWHFVHNRLVNMSSAASSTPALPLEVLNDLVGDPSSASRDLARRYTSEVVRRYADRPTVLFWELGNELNLHANQPSGCSSTTPHVTRGDAPPEATQPNATTASAPPSSSQAAATSAGDNAVGHGGGGGRSGGGGRRCFNTSSLVEYTRELVEAVRRADPARPISSGFGLTRPTAWHQEVCTATSSPRMCGGIDSLRQWKEMVLWQHEAVDIISAHAYAGLRGCYFEGYRFKVGCRRQSNVTVLSAAAEAAKSVGKPLYVGEFGGAPPNFTGPSVEHQAFPEAVLRWQVATSAERRRRDPVPDAAPRTLTSLWGWMCPAKRATMRCIWPNASSVLSVRHGVGVRTRGWRDGEEGSDRMLSLLQWANRRLGGQNRWASLVHGVGREGSLEPLDAWG